VKKTAETGELYLIKAKELAKKQKKKLNKNSKFRMLSFFFND